MTPQRRSASHQGCPMRLPGSLGLHAAMRKGVSHRLENALDNGRNFAGDPAVLLPKA